MRESHSIIVLCLFSSQFSIIMETSHPKSAKGFASPSALFAVAIFFISPVVMKQIFIIILFKLRYFIAVISKFRLKQYICHFMETVCY